MELLNKVPEVTLYFWIIKILATTVGETAADYLNVDLGFGLNYTSLVTFALLAVLLVVQFRTSRYVPGVYWSVVLVISVAGTLVTDNLTDNLGISLTVSTAVFAVLLALVFVAWWSRERTLSIHSIISVPREAFYWLTVLVTFALGTAAGDLFSEGVGLGYAVSLAIFVGIIALVAIAHFVLRWNAVGTFWVAYVLTRPLGASLGDLLSQPRDAGGLGLGATGTSYLFVGLMIVLVAYLTWSKRDRTPPELVAAEVAA